MMFSDLVVGLIIFVLIMTMMVFMIEMVVPLQKEAKFNSFCRQYYLQIEKNGGLTTEEIGSLKEGIEAMDFEIVTTYLPAIETHHKGEAMVFYVDCIYKRKEISGVTYRNQKTYHFIYEKTLISRQIINTEN